MANTKAVHLESFEAAADLSAKQFYFVKLSANRTVNVPTAITDIPIGVLQNKPASGEAAEVMVIGRSKVSADETLTAGQLIGTSVDGQAALVEAGDTTVYRAGQVTIGAGAGEIAEAIINCVNLNVAP
ncbi:hypothetical protein KKF61_07415 [Patescibacteria group bacterium]|nr:hypothetical protein [Patescibacteria group bacterium]